MADEKGYAKIASQKKAKKAMARARREQIQRRQNKRAQRYLRLRTRVNASLTKPLGQADLIEEGYLKGDPSIPDEPPKPESTTTPVALPSDKGILLISMDLECYERDHNKITEIGVSQLDTEDLQGPGENAKEWFSLMKHEHFRIRDHDYLRNGSFVNDNADRFQFGTSQWITLTEAKTKVDEILHAKEKDGKPRQVVLVGHNMKSDIGYLRKIGCEISDADNVIDILDTEIMYRALQDRPENISLSKLCYNLDIDAWCLHNAGNDAAYTLQCFVLMTLKSSKGEIGAFKPEPEADESDGGDGVVVWE